MGLTNSQKSRIIKIAQENNYEGDYESLFEQAMTDGIFDTPPEPDVEAKKEDHRLDVDNIIVDPNQKEVRSALGKSNIELPPHINSAHEAWNMPSALKQFLEDPSYQFQQEAKTGGFKKYNEGGSVNDTETVFIENDTHLNIIRPEGDPWEYAKQSDGSVITRRRALEGQEPTEWVKPRQDSVAYQGIKNNIIFDNSPKIHNLNQTDSDEARAIYNTDKTDSSNLLDAETRSILNAEANNTSNIQNMLVSSGYDLGNTGPKNDGVDGDWGPKTSAAFNKWSEKNLSNLPIYQGERENICIPGGGCSEVATNFLMQLFPDITDRNDLGPADAWYRAKHVVELGGEKIWGVSDKEAKGNWNDLPDLPPVEVWKNLQIGDLIHLNRPGETKTKKESNLGYSLDMNRGTEHVGFIIGKDPNSGLPLIAHGDQDGMFVQPINEITLGGVLQKQYKVDAITRSRGTKNTKPNLKDHYVFNTDRKDMLHLENDAQLNMSSLNPLDKDFFPATYVNWMNTRMDNIAKTTGYSRELVAEASKIGYGIFANETGDWSGILKGKAKEFAKDMFDANLLANLREIPADIKNYWETGEGIGNFIFPDKGVHVSPDHSEPSRGVTRIKFDMQTHDRDGNITKLGQWYKANNITKEDLSWTNPDIIRSMHSGYEAVTLQTLDYIRRAKNHKEYDPKTNTIAGVPLYYAVATMHKSPVLSKRVDENHTVLDYLKKGDRDYSNAVINKMKTIKIKYDDGSGTGEIEKAQEFYKINNPQDFIDNNPIDRNIIQRYLDKISKNK